MTPGSDASTGRQAFGEIAIISFGAALLCTMYSATTDPGVNFNIDHRVFLDTVGYMRDGIGYHESFVRAFGDQGIAISEVRSVREPLPFLVWQFIPLDRLWFAYLVLVTATATAMSRLTPYAPLGLAVAGYLLIAGRIRSTMNVDQWMLVELWTVLPIALSLAFWRRERHVTSVGFAVVAVLMREIAVGYLLVSWALAVLRRDAGRRQRVVAWTGGVVVATIGYGIHAIAASSSGVLAEVGSHPPVLGSGSPPASIWDMMAWMVPGPTVVGVVLYAIALVRIVRHRHDLLPLIGVFVIAAAGLSVDRTYWGFLFIPFVILLGLEQVIDTVSRARARHPRPDRRPTSKSA